MKVVLMKGTCHEIHMAEMLILASDATVSDIKKSKSPVMHEDQANYNSKVYTRSCRLTFDKKFWIFCKYIVLRFYYNELNNYASILTNEEGREYLKNMRPYLIPDNNGQVKEVINGKQ